MGDPKVSILWLNYNSSSFMELAAESLRGVEDLDYPNYELIVVDNCSSDGSFKAVTDILAKMRCRARMIRLAKNLGFTGGNNIAYRARYPNSEYVALLNNDAVPYRDSLRDLVEYMEGDERVAAAQGVILNNDGTVIDTAGNFISETLGSLPLLRGSNPKSLTKEFDISYADGCYSIYRIAAVRNAVRSDDRLFDDDMFAYYDDSILGLKLWHSGFKTRTVPVIAARHERSSSFKGNRALRTYLGTRGQVVLNEISNSRYKNLIRMSHVKRALRTEARRALRDGIRIGVTKRKLGERIDIYRAPVVRVDPFVGFVGCLAFLRVVDKSIIKAHPSLRMWDESSPE